MKEVRGGKTIYTVYSRMTGGLVYRDEATDNTRTDYVNVGGGPVKVGEGWPFLDYFSADFTGDGVLDFVVKTEAGDLLYFPWKGTSF